eukprot:1038286-Pelagomonas_calceolata.AAC.1
MEACQERNKVSIWKLGKTYTPRSNCNALQFQGASGGGVCCTAMENGRRRIWASRSMADNPPDPH